MKEAAKLPGGPSSTNLCDGSNWAYPDADYPQRDRIWNDHLHYTYSLRYFMGHDPSVPENIRAEARQWGGTGAVAADAFKFEWVK